MDTPSCSPKVLECICSGESSGLWDMCINMRCSTSNPGDIEGTYSALGVTVKLQCWYMFPCSRLPSDITLLPVTLLPCVYVGTLKIAAIPRLLKLPSRSLTADPPCRFLVVEYGIYIQFGGFPHKDSTRGILQAILPFVRFICAMLPPCLE